MTEQWWGRGAAAATNRGPQHLLRPSAVVEVVHRLPTLVAWSSG